MTAYGLFSKIILKLKIWDPSTFQNKLLGKKRKQDEHKNINLEDDSNRKTTNIKVKNKTHNYFV